MKDIEMLWSDFELESTQTMIDTTDMILDMLLKEVIVSLSNIHS